MIKTNSYLTASILGVLLWLTILPNLLLLPPTEVAQTIQLFEKTIAETPKCMSGCEATPEWKIQMLDYIAKPQEQENILWVKWIATLSLNIRCHYCLDAFLSSQINLKMVYFNYLTYFHSVKYSLFNYYIFRFLKNAFSWHSSPDSLANCCFRYLLPCRYAASTCRFNNNGI